MKNPFQPVIALAERYGILVRMGPPSSPSRPKGASRHTTRGPRGHWCDVQEKIVYFDDDPSEYDQSDPEIETHLHEVAHVIVQPPWWSIDEVPEDFLLMPVERVLARTVLSDRGYERVINWQEDTNVGIIQYGEALGSIPNYTRTKPWRNAFALARLVGILNKHNRPTFKMPDWKKAKPFKASLWEYIEDAGKSDPWGGKGVPA